MTRARSHERDLTTKVKLRRKALKELKGGDERIYVPFCGFGDCAKQANYPMERVFGNDTDHDAIRHWHRAWPKARIIAERAERHSVWPQHVIGLIDIDPFGNGFKALDRVLRYGLLADPLQIVVTDGSIEKIARSGTPYNFDALKFGKKATQLATDQHQRWLWHVSEWLGQFGTVLRFREGYDVRQMRYWWFTLDGLPDPGERLGLEYNREQGKIEGETPVADEEFDLPEESLDNYQRRVPIWR